MLDIPLQSGSGDPLIRGRFSKALELSSSSPGDPEIVALLEANISAGDPASMVLLGDVFSDGGSEQRSRSVELFREASRLGDASGTRNLAYCYAIGLNVAKDKAEAAKLYIAAGEMGNARAMCNIGVMYDYGNGVIQDRTAAFAWYVRSAQAGNKRGMTNLGEFYMLGKGTDRNLKLAAVWLERSGSPRALNASAQAISGAVLVGSDSTLALTLTDNSSFEGRIGGNIVDASGQTVSTEVGTAIVTLDSGSTWTLTGDSYITSFSGDAENVIGNGYTLYVNGTALCGTG